MRWEHLSYTIPLRLRSLFRRKHVEQELEEELQYHLDRKIEEAIAQGATPEEARYAARRAMQGLEQRKEECRDMRRVVGIESLIRDLRFGLRMLAMSPRFTAAAVLTLALGIGANTAIYSVVKNVLLEPLPYPDPDRIVQLMLSSPEWAIGKNVFTINEAEFNLWRKDRDFFKDVAAYDDRAYGLNLGGSDRPEQISALSVSADYFRLLGAPMQMGRTFSPEEDSPGGPRVAVISNGLWHRRFSADPHIVGKTITAKGEPLVVIGVLGAGFVPHDFSEIWLPLQINPNSTNLALSLRAAARLQPGVTLEAARERLKADCNQFHKLFPEFNHRSYLEGFTAELMRDAIVENVRVALLIALGAVSLVLLIACANVANLILARASGRRRELAIRSALGGSRFRIVSQLLVEYVALALAGGVAGIPLAYLGLRGLMAVSPGDIPRLGTNGTGAAFDWQVFLFTTLLSLTTGVVFGLLPAWLASAPGLSTALNESGTRTSPGASQKRSRSVLVVVEMALALILLAGATLLIRTLNAITGMNPGFDAQNVLVLEMSLGESRFRSSAAVGELVREAERRVESLPGVTALAATYSLPLHENQFGGPLVVEGLPDEGSLGAQQYFVSRHYFDVFRIPLRRGRIFSERDSIKAQEVVLINETMARGSGSGSSLEAPIHWRTGDPLSGERITFFKNDGPPLEDHQRLIVGVVGDSKNYRLHEQMIADAYIPLAQLTDEFTRELSKTPLYWTVRTKSEPLAFSDAIQRELRAASGGLPVAHIQAMTQVRNASTAQERFNMTLLSIFAGIAVLLAAIGVYGVMAYAVEEQTKEIGIRLALGAPPRQVVRTLLSEGMRLALVGVAIGILGSLGLMRFIRSLLFAVESSDPVTLVMTSVFLSIVALLAIYVPSRRATRIDPLQALRWE